MGVHEWSEAGILYNQKGRLRLNWTKRSMKRSGFEQGSHELRTALGLQLLLNVTTQACQISKSCICRLFGFL